MILDIILLLHLSLIILITQRILWRNDLTPVSRLAWFIIIVLFPYFGALIYWLFGEVKLGFRADSEAQKIINRLQTFAPQVLGQVNTLTDKIPMNYRHGFAYAQSVNGFYPVAGNRIELLEDADSTLQRMIADIDAAREQVHVLYYIWLSDHTGTSIAEALMRAAKRGVVCRVMADAMGSRTLIKSDLWQTMRQTGIEVVSVLPFDNLIKTLLLSRIDLRNHRKITIIDGKITYCGSQNCADPAFLVKPKYAPWVDIMFRIEGPVVAQNQLLFASDWLKVKPNTAMDKFIFNTENSQGNSIAAIFGDGPTERQTASPQLFSTLFSQAESEIVISTPYFVPDYLTLGALCAAAYRGVKVSLIVPYRNDSFIVAASSRSYYHQLLTAGVHIYEYRNGLLHAKTLTIDGQCSMIGSTNLDMRSFDLNYENNVLIYDQQISQNIRKRQSTYINSSSKVDLNTVNNWSYARRLWNNVVATIGPVL
ncbi:MAG: cardiolipin synthase [Alcaligenaceae bacterium]|nr:cardiolipin synthase [Alcaligenaceae bacterium]